jgi:hypothetical protein
MRSELLQLTLVTRLFMLTSRKDQETVAVLKDYEVPEDDVVRDDGVNA